MLAMMSTTSTTVVHVANKHEQHYCCKASRHIRNKKWLGDCYNVQRLYLL
jgi:hypothetical protein